LKIPKICLKPFFPIREQDDITKIFYLNLNPFYKIKTLFVNDEGGFFVFSILPVLFSYWH